MRRARRRDRERDLIARLRRNVDASLDAARPRRVRTRSARYAACLAERLGLIERPGCCEWCRRRARLHRHHWSYDEPLNVSFLCGDCHGLADAMNRTDTA